MFHVVNLSGKNDGPWAVILNGGCIIAVFISEAAANKFCEDLNSAEIIEPSAINDFLESNTCRDNYCNLVQNYLKLRKIEEEQQETSIAPH